MSLLFTVVGPVSESDGSQRLKVRLIRVVARAWLGGSRVGAAAARARSLVHDAASSDFKGHCRGGGWSDDADLALHGLQRLAADGRPHLTDDRFSEADLRLLPALYRHDPVCTLRMKPNAAGILDDPNLWGWLCRVFALPGVAASNALTHCRQGYFGRAWNKGVPLGPLKPMSCREA